MVQNSTQLRAFLYLFVLVLFSLTLVCIYFVIVLLPTVAFGAAFPLIFVAGMLGYGTYLGLVLIKFMKAKADYDEEGITVSLGSESNRYLWSDVDKVVRCGLGFAYRFYDVNGKTIYMLVETTSGWYDLKVSVSREVGI